MAVPKLLIVVLPGIGGSMLSVPGAHGRPVGKPIWSAALRDVNLVIRPEHLDVDKHEHLIPVGLIPTRKVFGVWTVVPGYDRLMKRLAARFGGPLDDGTPMNHNPDAIVAGIGYDFRRSIAQAAQHMDSQIRARVAHLWPEEKQPQDKVLVVAHSMGGLVARYWVAVLGGDRLCRGLITLGTPHRGAPKALDVLANGIPVKGGHLGRPREVLRKWEGAAELLPRYPAIHDETAPTEPGQNPVMRRAKDFPVPWLAARAKQAFEVHEEIRIGWAALESRPALFPRIGFGHRTLRDCSWDGARFTVTADDPLGDELGGWATALGDGTVPAFSGQPLELDKHPRYGLTVPEKHGPIAQLAEVEAIVESFLDDAALARYHGAEVTAVLTLDVDDLQIAGTPFEIQGALRSPGGPLEVDPSDAKAWLTVQPIDEATEEPGEPVVEEPLRWDDHSGLFSHTLGGFGPGLYEMTLTTEELAGGLSSTQTIEVLDDDELS